MRGAIPAVPPGVQQGAAESRSAPGRCENRWKKDREESRTQHHFKVILKGKPTADHLLILVQILLSNRKPAMHPNHPQGACFSLGDQPGLSTSLSFCFLRELSCSCSDNLSCNVKIPSLSVKRICFGVRAVRPCVVLQGTPVCMGCSFCKAVAGKGLSLRLTCSGKGKAFVGPYSMEADCIGGA